MAASAPYPKISSKAWRVLRSRASSAPTTKFTPSAVAALLGMSSPKSAADNIVYPLRRVGLLNDEGGLTDRGGKWRVDASYADACQEILQDVYPDELQGLTSADGTPDREKILTWFQHRGFGGSNATQMAATYAMIAEKRVPDAPDPDVKKKSPSGEPAKRKPQQRASARTNATPATSLTPDPASGPRQPEDPAPKSRATGPNVHLDIQIHIPADASLDQIDQIFASMAKHLYQK